MNILNRYILKKVLTVFIVSCCVLTFIVLSGSLYGQIRKGLPFDVIGKAVLLLLPQVLSLSLPIALLVSCILVFNRLSQDYEITAIRSSGIGIKKIITPVLILSLIVSIFCLYLNTFKITDSKYKLSILKEELLLKNITSFLQEGEYIKFNNNIFYCSKVTEQEQTSKDSKNYKAENIHIRTYDKDNNLIQLITAPTGEIKSLWKQKKVILTLYNQRISIYGNNLQQGFAKQATHEFFVTKKQSTLQKRDKYLNFKESFVRQQLLQDKTKKDINFYLLSKKIALSFSPCSFVFLALAFGFQQVRSKSSYGLLLSMILAMCYFACILGSELLVKNYTSLASLIVWMPNILYQAGGLFALWNFERT